MTGPLGESHCSLYFNGEYLPSTMMKDNTLGGGGGGGGGGDCNTIERSGC